MVDDEPQILRALRINLTTRGYEVTTAATGAGALRAVAERAPDVIVLDLGLPDMDGTQVLGGLRGWTEVPVIVLSARTDSADKVAALDAGADDYLTKPFGMEEFLARLRAALRRGASPAGENAPVVVTDAFTVDLMTKTVTRDGSAVHLTPTEWGIPRDARPQSRKAGGPEGAAPGGVGACVRDGDALPTGVRRPAAAQA